MNTEVVLALALAQVNPKPMNMDIKCLENRSQLWLTRLSVAVLRHRVRVALGPRLGAAAHRMARLVVQSE